MQQAQSARPKETVMDKFVSGARRGFTVATVNMLPNVVMAFIIIQALNVSGLLPLIGRVFGPVMAVWGLPGEAITVLVSAFMSIGGGVGAAAGLVGTRHLSFTDVTILAPAIQLMGSLIQWVGRILGTAEVNSKYWPHCVILAIINAMLAMWVMRFLVALF